MTTDPTAIAARNAARTPGSWAWFGYAQSNQIYLATQAGGRRTVMDFVRWGMRAAQPRFQSERLMRNIPDLIERGEVQAKTYAPQEILGASHPDMVFIAHAPDDITALLALTTAQSAEIAGLRAELAESRAYAGKLADGLPMLPKDVELLEQGNVRMATQLVEIEAAIRNVCPVENNDVRMADGESEPTEVELSRYVCFDDEANKIFDAHTLPEAVAQALGRWTQCGETVGQLQQQLNALRAAPVLAWLVDAGDELGQCTVRASELNASLTIAEFVRAGYTITPLVAQPEAL